MQRTRLPLWDDTPDGPSLTLYPTDRPTVRGGVLICPGGGYWKHAGHEGRDIAEFLAAAGFDCGVVLYRLAPDHKHPEMIHDAMRAMRMMRADDRIKARKIAVLGFSAGGHLASTLATMPEAFPNENDDLAGSHAARPDAAVLCYPVIDMAGEATHEGSHHALLGEEASRELREKLSTHRQVDGQTPPTFLWHTVEDEPVPVENGLLFARACRGAGVPFEMHLYENGKHGLGMAQGLPGVESWVELAMLFLDRHLDATMPAEGVDTGRVAPEDTGTTERAGQAKG